MNKLLKDLYWDAPDSWQKISTIDMHTGGEPLRIPISGLPEIKGNSVLEKRRYFMENFDHLRTGLMFEPRGHADMYGAIISEASSEDLLWVSPPNLFSNVVVIFVVPVAVPVLVVASDRSGFRRTPDI